MKKRMTMIAVLVILAISLVLFTGTAGADGEPQACGNGVSWTLSDTGILAISYTGGEMGEHPGEMTSHPWTETRADDVRKVVISEGVTTICEEAFAGCTNLTEITVPASMEIIEPKIVNGCSQLTTVHYNKLALDWDMLIFSGEGLSALSRDAITLDCIQESPAGTAYQAAFTHLREDGETQDLVPTQSDEATYYSVDVNTKVHFSFSAPKNENYTVSFRLCEGSLWWTELEPNQLTETTAEFIDYPIVVSESWQGYTNYTLKVVYLPVSGNGPALVSECSVQFRTVSHGDGGISVAIPYHYIKSQNPGEGAGLSVTVQVPEGVGIYQEYIQALTYRDGKECYIAAIKTGDHTYMIPDSELTAGEIYEVSADVYPIGYDRVYCTQEVPVLYETGSAITLMLRDGENPVSGTLQTGKAYTLTVSTTDDSIQGIEVWTGTEREYLDSQGGSIPVYFLRTGTYAISAWGTTGQQGNSETKTATPIQVTVASTKGPIGQPTVTTDADEYKQGDGIEVTLTQPAESEAFYLKIVTADMQKSVCATTRVSATKDGTLTKVFPSSYLDANAYYMIQVECYATGYEASTVYSQAFYLTPGSANPAAGTLPAPTYSTDIVNETVERGNVIHVVFDDCPVIADVTVQPDVRFSAVLYDAGTTYGRYLGGWSVNPLNSHEILVPTADLVAGTQYRLDLMTEANGWESGSTSIQFTVTEPENAPAAFRLGKTPKVYEKTDVVLYEAGAKWLKVEITWEENGNQRNDTLQTPGSAGAWSWTPRSKGTYTLTPRAYSGEYATNEIENISAKPITVTVTSDGTMSRVQMKDYPTSIGTGEDLSFTFYAVDNAEYYQVSLGYGMTESTNDREWIPVPDILQPAGATGTTQISAMIPGSKLDREGYYRLALVPISAGYEPSWASWSIHATANSSTWSWAIDDADTLFEGATMTISGTGEIPDYENASDAPWWKTTQSTTAKVNRIVIEEGITGIGKNALAGFGGTLRVDFMHSAQPEIDADAFGGGSAVCRYFDNTTAPASWTGTFNGNVSWMYLPFMPTSTITISYIGENNGSGGIAYKWTAGGAGSPFAEAIEVTRAQAKELSFSQRWVSLSAIPTAAEDRAVYEAMDAPTRLVFWCGSETEYVLDLSTATRAPEEIECNSDGLRLKVIAPAESTLGSMVVRDGAGITYNGNIGQLELRNSQDEAPAALTVNGNISEVHYYTMESGYEGYRGSFTLNGTIGRMTVYGQNEIYVPGISGDENHKVTIDDMACMTYDNLTRTGEDPLITWNGDTGVTELHLAAGEAGTPVSGLTLDMFTYDYTFRENDVVSFCLRPKEESGLGNRSSFIYNVREKHNPNFGPNDIIRGSDTVVYIQNTGTAETDKITLGPWADGQGVDRIYLQNCRVEINCPVTGTLGVWQYAFDDGPVYVAINDRVRQLVLVLNRAGGSVAVGQNGIIEGGYQTLGVRGLRHFGLFRGAGTLAADGQLSILTRKDGQQTLSLPAKDSEVTAAVSAGTLNEGEIARMDINDAAANDLTEAEQAALNGYLAAQANEDNPLTVEGVIDVSVDAYSFTVGGANDKKERPITSLKNSVPVQIGNSTGKTVGVVRLHEEEGSMKATSVTEEMTGGSLISFESDLFSKYVIVSNGQAADPLPCGNGVVWVLQNGVLTISYTGTGSGEMTSHPWTDRAGEITTVIIEEGVTSICSRAFAGCSSMTGITIPGTIYEFPGAFEGCTALTTVHYGGIRLDWEDFLIFEDGPGYQPVMDVANVTYRASEPIGQIEGYSFAFTAAREDGTALEDEDSGDNNVTRYLYRNYEIVKLTLSAPDLPGYTKTYRLETDNPTVRLNPGTDGTVVLTRQLIMLSAGRDIWFRAFAVYVPVDDTKPVLVAQSKQMEFRVDDLRTLDVVASAPTGYALGTEGGYAVTVTIPDSIEIADLVGWSLRVIGNNYNTVFMRPTMDETLVLKTGVNTIGIPDSPLQAGKQYTLQFTMAVKGYSKYVFEKRIVIVGEGEDPDKVLDVPEISLERDWYYQGEKARLTLGKVENAASYALRVYSQANPEGTDYYTRTVSAEAFGEQDSMLIEIPTADLPVSVGRFYLAVECTADGYVGNSNETVFWLDPPATPYVTVSSPETYTKKRVPTDADGLVVTARMQQQMNNAEADDWTLTVFDENNANVYTIRKQNGDTYTGSFVIPEKNPAAETDILVAGKTYTYTLSIRFAGYTEYNSGARTFSVLGAPSDSVSCESSVYMTPEGQKQVLYITAYGPITEEDAAKWAGLKTGVDKIILNGDITSICSNAFAGFTKDGLRIDFNQSRMPEFSPTAFSGSGNIVCRYYTNNDTWTEGNYGAQSMRWVYLPVHEGTFDGQTAYFDYTAEYGWSYKLFNNETYGRDRYPMSVEQAAEIALGKYKVIDFYAIPTAADQAFYAGWEKMQRIGIYDGVAGELTIALPERNNLFEMTIDSHAAAVTVTNPETLNALKCRSGVVTYTGNIQNLTLDSAEAANDSITVNGYVGSLSFNDATADSPYKGDMTLKGSIGHGVVQGKGSLTIPGVGKKEFGNLAQSTFEYLEAEEPLKVIEDGVLQVESTRFQVSLDMYGLTYFISDHNGSRMISLGLEPLDEYREIIGGDYMRYDNLNIATDEFVYGEDTQITIQASSAVGPVVLNGAEEGGKLKGVSSIYFMHGQAVVNCPVNTLTIDNGREFTEGVILTINSEVDYLNMSDLNSGSVILGSGGKVREGYWQRRSRANRNFGTVSAEGTLYANGSLNAMSWRDGETLQAMLPAENVIADAAGLGAGVMVSAEVSESSIQALNEAESTALDSYLAANGGTVAAVFDASINTYTLDGNGNASQGAAVTELNTSVPFTVSNETGGACYVVRLHEDASGAMAAESLTEPTDGEAIEFRSSRFSKFVLVSTEEESISYEFGQNTNEYVKGEWTLYIKGRGAIPSYSTSTGENAPWSEAVAGKENIRIVIGERITGIGANAFANLGGTTRVDFLGTTMPLTDGNAFAGSNVICHYYRNTESWTLGTAGRTDAEWIFLPKIYEEEYPGVGSIDYMQPEGAALGWYSYMNDDPYLLTMRQAEEISYHHLTVWLYEIPTEADAALYAGRNIPWRVYVLDNCEEGILNLDADHGGNTLELVDLSASQVTVNVEHADTYWPVFRTSVSDGTLNYTGNISKLELMNSFTGNEPAVTVHGNIGTLVFHDIESSQAYIGDLEVVGTIASGTEYGSGTLSIPGVGADIELDGKVREFTGLTMAEGDGKLIEKGVFRRTDIPAAHHSLADYRLKYMFRDQEGTEFDDTTLTLSPKGSDGQGIVIDILKYNPNFSEDDIIWGPDTDISVHWWDPDNQNHQLTLNGGTDGTGINDLFNNSSYGTVTVNCPVNIIEVYQAEERGDAITLQVNSTVSSAILNMRGKGSIIRLGQNGQMNSINWSRYLYGTRVVPEVQGPCTLVEDGRLCVLSAKQGETLQSILPGDTVLANAAGMDAVMDISESNEGLSEAEQAKIDGLLSGTTDEVETVFEISVTGYADGIGEGTGTPLYNLTGEVQMAVANTTGGEAYVARLHTENGVLTAEAVSKPTADSVLLFESDRFSKYMIIAAGETFDPSGLNTLTLPDSLTRIEEEAFAGGAFQAVIVPDTCTYIGPKAFENCTNLIYVSLPAGCQVDEHAFDGCNIQHRIERNN